MMCALRVSAARLSTRMATTAWVCSKRRASMAPAQGITMGIINQRARLK